MPVNAQGELTNGASKKAPRARKPGQTRYGSGGRPWKLFAQSSDSSRQAPQAEDVTASWSGVAPRSRRRTSPMNGAVSPAKTVYRRVAEMSMRRARRVSGLNRDPIMSVLRAWPGRGGDPFLNRPTNDYYASPPGRLASRTCSLTLRRNDDLGRLQSAS